MTIYEKIKNMSENELAEFLANDSFTCNECEEGQNLCDCPLSKYDTCSQDCKKNCLNWLKKESN